MPTRRRSTLQATLILETALPASASIKRANGSRSSRAASTMAKNLSACALMWNSEEFPFAGYPKRNNYERARIHVEEGYRDKKADIQAVMNTWLEQDVLPGVEELMTRSGTVDYMWFDGFYWPAMGLDLQSDRMKKMILGHQPKILLSPRYNYWGESAKFGDLATAENRFPTTRPTGPWEFCWCMRGSWFHRGMPDRPHQDGPPAVTVLAELAKCRAWEEAHTQEAMQQWLNEGRTESCSWTPEMCASVESAAKGQTGVPGSAPSANSSSTTRRRQNCATGR